MIPAEAVEAAAEALWQPAEGGVDWAGEYDTYKDYLRAEATRVLEAAAPHMLADMRPLNLAELEERDNPEMMRVARKRIRAEVREFQQEIRRAYRESAYDDGFTACAVEHSKQHKDPSHPITRTNPYRTEP